MKIFSENLKTVYTLVALVGICLAGIGYFAKAADLNRLKLRVDAGFLEDRIANMQKRIWALEDRYGTGCTRCSQSEKEEYRKLIMDMGKLQKEVDAMTQKKYKG